MIALLVLTLAVVSLVLAASSYSIWRYWQGGFSGWHSTVREIFLTPTRIITVTAPTFMFVGGVYLWTKYLDWKEA